MYKSLFKYYLATDGEVEKVVCNLRLYVSIWFHGILRYQFFP